MIAGPARVGDDHAGLGVELMIEGEGQVDAPQVTVAPGAVHGGGQGVQRVAQRRPGRLGRRPGRVEAQSVQLADGMRPQPPPAGARLPHLRCRLRGKAGQGALEQAVVDRVVLSRPGAALLAIDELRQRVPVSSAASFSSSIRPSARAAYSAPWPRRNSGTSDSWTSEVTA